MRITGDEDEGKAELDNFINPQERYPVIATTSKLLSTGVDAQTCKLIVLDQRIQSMTHFKQIIGRGTRINEDYDKYFFTIMDFKKATELFADPAFDGEPVQIYQPQANDSPVPPDVDEDETGASEGADRQEGSPSTESSFIGGDEPEAAARKYYVANVPIYVIAERVQYYGPDGKLITESLKDYTRKTVRKDYTTYNDFLRKWAETDRKQLIIEELEERGVLFDELAESVGRAYSAFDLICHIAFDQPPLTRRERTEKVRKRSYFTKYGDKAREVLNYILEKYSDGGIEDLDNLDLLKVPPIDRLGTPLEIVNIFGSKDDYIKALQELEDQLYMAEAA